MIIQKYIMKKIPLLLLVAFLGTNQLRAQDSAQIILGSEHTIWSDVLNEEREYWISLPASYEDDMSAYKNYPVLIVLDGNTHFKALSSMVDYMSADRYRSRKIPGMIVVGIQNVDRRRDFTPDKVITVRENNTGGGDLFLNFLENELLPELDKKYRTSPYRILFGHSLGGLLATHAYLKDKTGFNAFIAADPSFGTWDAETMDRKVDSMSEHSFDRFIYIATANWGKRNIRNRDRHLRFYELLNSKTDGVLPAKIEYFEDESHSSVSLIAFHNGMNTIFEGYGISYRDIATKEQLIQHFQGISQRLSWDILPPERLVNQIGYRLLRSSNEDERNRALEFFQLNVEYYPESSNAFDSLGEAYEVYAETQKAITAYQRSLDLNPDNVHASQKIRELSGRN